MQVDGYDIDIVIPGYPGKSVCHGAWGEGTRRGSACLLT